MEPDHNLWFRHLGVQRNTGWQLKVDEVKLCGANKKIIILLFLVLKKPCRATNAIVKNVRKPVFRI